MRKDSKAAYLKAILKIRVAKGFCRAVDVANEMHVARSSVSVAVKKLVNAGYAVINGKDIVLTLEGYDIIRNDNVITKKDFFIYFLKQTGVPEELADRDATRLEKDLSDESYIAIKKWLTNQIFTQLYPNK